MTPSAINKGFAHRVRGSFGNLTRSRHACRGVTTVVSYPSTAKVAEGRGASGREMGAPVVERPRHWPMTLIQGGDEGNAGNYQPLELSG
jgi:hypothetical protein